jgi:hypothetical protein
MNALVVTAFIGMVLSASVSASPAAVDPFDGNWTLDLKLSHYESGALPQQMTITIATAGSEVHYRSQIVEGNGRRSDSEYRAEYGGVPVIVTGTFGLMAPVSLNRVGPRIVVATFTRSLRIIATSRREIDAPGLTMTVTTQSQDPQGKTLTNVGIYRRKER